MWAGLVRSSRQQIYLSRSFDPFVNLSIEHFLLQKSPPHAIVLFLYQNRPCVVIGRNQNPWLEVKLNALTQHQSSHKTSRTNDSDHSSNQDAIELVRRRSGGGTVFHDHGNVNYSVICPTADFTRDKHAEMVTKAIRNVNARARVNERHDIVLDQGALTDREDWADEADMHRTRFHTHEGKTGPLKISGSAYKLTRQRALHHGTCLISTKDLFRISRHLNSPARPFMKARGVESVRSPIGNVYGDSQAMNDDHVVSSRVNTFKQDVIQEFVKMYNIDMKILEHFASQGQGYRYGGNEEWAAGWVDDEQAKIQEIGDGIQEMKSMKWVHGQTPQFTLSSHPTEEDDRQRPSLPNDFPPFVSVHQDHLVIKHRHGPLTYSRTQAQVHLKVKSGVIVSSQISISSDVEAAKEEAHTFDSSLSHRSIDEINNFTELLECSCPLSEVLEISKWLNYMFGKLNPP